MTLAYHRLKSVAKTGRLKTEENPFAFFDAKCAGRYNPGGKYLPRFGQLRAGGGCALRTLTPAARKTP